MKKILLSAIMIISSVLVNAQDFLGYSFEKYKGLDLKLTGYPSSIDKDKSLTSFYTSIKDKKGNSDFKLNLKSINIKNVNELKEKDFNVVDAFKFNDKNILQLYNNDIGTVYYSIGLVSPYEFPFSIVDKNKIPLEYYKGKFSVYNNEFDNIKAYNSDYFNYYGVVSKVFMLDKNSHYYILELKAKSRNLISNSFKNNLDIILENGEKYNFNDISITTDVKNGEYIHKAKLYLTKDLIDKLKNNKIKKYRIGDIEEGGFLNEHIENLKGYFKVLEEIDLKN